MANEKEDVLQANAGAPAANIPDLKKKEKERKKAGAAWSGARGAAGDFSGATGGTVARAAASAVGAVGEGVGLIEAESGGFFASIARLLGLGGAWASLTSSLVGRMAVGAAAFLMMAAAGILGYGALKGSGSGPMGSPNLGGISDSMRVRAGGDDRLGVDSKGEIRFDPASAAKQPAAPPPPVAKAAEEPAPAPMADVDALKPVPSGQLAHNQYGALSSSLGGDFGSKNIFAGNSGAPKFGAGLSKIGGVKGQLSAAKASTRHATPSARTTNKGSANKAFGQLRLAKGLSQQGAGASTAEQAAASSQGAFDQQQAIGGALATTGAPGGDKAPSTDPGAPDTTVSDPPGTPTTEADPPYQNIMQQIDDLANKAMSDIQTGTMMLALGALLIGIGIGLLFVAPAAGAALIAAGAALVAMGIMKIMQGKAEEAQALAMGQQLGNSIGGEQGQTVNTCTQNAVNTGTTVQSCQPSTDVTNENAQDTTDIDKVKQIPVGSAKIISN